MIDPQACIYISLSMMWFVLLFSIYERRLLSSPLFGVYCELSGAFAVLSYLYVLITMEVIHFWISRSVFYSLDGKKTPPQIYLFSVKLKFRFYLQAS